MIPSKKSEEIELAMREIFGVDRRLIIQANVCTSCGCDVIKKGFTDSLSIKEYSISGFCQTCQNIVFDE